ncbi:MAG: hypothetical protein EOO77_22285 [Oxalobacteraceae bacterium]|nr:MAG: hypothetical protein EOO77_22285 [Oxalobacteraceae bacterium]
MVLINRHPQVDGPLSTTFCHSASQSEARPLSRFAQLAPTVVKSPKINLCIRYRTPRKHDPILLVAYPASGRREGSLVG